MQDGVCLRHFRDDIAAMEILSFLYCDVCRPFLLPVKKIHADAAGDKRTRGIRDPLQRALDTVENIVEDPRGKCYGYGTSAGNNFLSRPKAGCLLIYLDRCQVFIQSNDFADKLFLSDIDHLGHAEAGIALQIDDGSVDPVYFPGLKHWHCRHLLRK